MGFSLGGGCFGEEFGLGGDGGMCMKVMKTLCRGVLEESRAETYDVLSTAPSTWESINNPPSSW